MSCKLCGSGNTTLFAAGHPYQRLHCHSCKGQEYKSLLITAVNWDKWINSEVEELVGTPAVVEPQGLLFA